MTSKFLPLVTSIVLCMASYDKGTISAQMTEDLEDHNPSLVPKKEQIDDTDAKKFYAKIIAQDPKQAAKALEIYRDLYKEDPDNFSLLIEIERTKWSLENPSSQKLLSDFVVPKNEWISDQEAKKLYAKLIANDPRQASKALEIYRALYKENPSDFLIRIAIERIKWSMQHPEEKEKKLSLIDKKEWIDSFKARLELARIYSAHKKTYLTAYENYYKLLEEKPGDTTALIELGFLYANDYRFSEAVTLLQALWQKNLPPSEKLAQLEEKLGYAAFSRDQFEELLQEGKISEETYANSMLTWGDFYRAEGIYKEALAKKPDSEKLQIQLIDTLIGSQRFEEAEELAHEYLKNASKDKNLFIERLATIKLFRKDYTASLEKIDQLLCLKPQEEKYFLDKADVLYKLKNYRQALEIYNFLKTSENLSASGYLGAGKTLLKLEEFEEARNDFLIAEQDPATRIKAQYFLAKEDALSPCFIQAVIANTKTAQELKLWGEAYASDGYSSPMPEFYEAASKLDGNYFPGHIAYADSLLTEKAYSKALAIYNLLLETFPGNANLLLAQARITSWNKQYAQSLELYGDLIALNPQNPVPKLERARVALWGKDFELSKLLYEHFLEETSHGGPAMENIHEKASIEFEINKLQWNGRIFQTLALYEKELELSPTNETWKYEYAQALCSLGLCDYSMNIYEEILEESPLNSTVGMAHQRQSLKERMSLSLNGSYWQEKGYGELSQIGRYGLNSMLTIPISCRQRMRIIPRHWLEHTYFDNGYHSADGVSLEWDSLFDAVLSAAAGATYKQYHHEFRDTFTGFGTLNFNIYSYFVASIGYSKLDEMCNYFNLKQKTQKDIYWGGIQSNINHKLSMNALAEGIRYSDHNSAAHCVLNANYAVTEFPTILKVGLTAEYRNTTHNNIFIYGPTGNLVNIIYPYWAPQRYFLGQVLLEIRHDYGWLEFCGAPQQFCDLKLAVGTDTQQNPYWEVKGEWLHEVYSGCKLGCTAYIHKSPMWDGKGFWFTCTHQF